MSYVVYYPKRDRPATRGDKAQFQIVEVPEGSSPDDVHPDDRRVLGSGYGTTAEAQRAIGKYKDRTRADTF